jgi:HEAT repeat protein
MRIYRSSLQSVVATALLTTLTFANVILADGPAASPEKEQELLAILKSDAAPADKAMTCKQLAIFGSGASVPELAKLLPVPELSSWARIALEAIPGSEANEALRTATGTLQGRLLVGTINSIGVRRDAAAVDTLDGKLKDADVDVAAAAAVALGRIGNDGAAAALRSALADAAPEVRSYVAEGCVLCAERLHSDGRTADAIAIYDAVRASDVHPQRIIEATRGAILARGQDGIPLLVEQLHATDRGLFRMALGTAREFPGSEIDNVLVTEMSKSKEDRAALIVRAMADRKDTVVLAAVLKAAEQGPQVVRLSAIDALSRVGDESCLTSLLRIAVDKDLELSAAARNTLAELPGDNVNAQIVALLPKAEGTTYPLLIELVGKRRIEAIPQLLKALDNSSNVVRTSALVALGETVSLKQLTVLIDQVVTPKNAEDAETAQKALKAASIRMADREACAKELSAAVERVKAVPVKVTLLQILGAMGGTTSLQTVGKAARSNDAQLQDASSRLLGEWMTEDAAPVLLDLAKLPSNPYQVRALRGYIRIARQFVLPDAQRTEMCQKAYDAAQQTAEKKLVVDILKRYPTVDNLKMAIRLMKVAELKDDATGAILVIAQKLGGKGVDVKELIASAGIEKMSLEIVKAEYGSGATQKDVTAVLKKQAGDLPIITLVSASYNASFGGDPLPGSVKQLKIQYRINGKAAEASFAEDALIVLPMPK